VALLEKVPLPMFDITPAKEYRLRAPASANVAGWRQELAVALSVAVAEDGGCCLFDVDAVAVAVASCCHHNAMHWQ